jgi:hypothetical protein
VYGDSAFHIGTLRMGADGALLPLDPRGTRLVEAAAVAGALERHVLGEGGQLAEVVQPQDHRVVDLALDLQRPLGGVERPDVVVVAHEEHLFGRVVRGQVAQARFQIHRPRAADDEPLLARHRRRRRRLLGGGGGEAQARGGDDRAGGDEEAAAG